jgi:hypothetical protein
MLGFTEWNAGTTNWNLIQPVAGALTGGAGKPPGIDWTWIDSVGAPTAIPGHVASLGTFVLHRGPMRIGTDHRTAHRFVRRSPRVPESPMTRALTRFRKRGAGRRGIALFTALTALILVSLATLGLFHLSLAETRRSRAGGFTVQAAAGADGGALAFMRDWPLVPWDTVMVGDTTPALTYTFAAARALVRATRLSPFVWNVVSTSESGDSSARTLARRHVTALFRLAVPDLAVDAALTARDSVSLLGSARIIGADTATGSWAVGCAPGAPGAAVASPDTTRTCDGTCAAHSGTRATGAPPLIVDSSALNPARYLSFGAESWATLTAHASVVLPAGSIVTPSPAALNGASDRGPTASRVTPRRSGPAGAIRRWSGHRATSRCAVAPDKASCWWMVTSPWRRAPSFTALSLRAMTSSEEQGAGS